VLVVVVKIVPLWLINVKHILPKIYTKRHHIAMIWEVENPCYNEVARVPFYFSIGSVFKAYR